MWYCIHRPPLVRCRGTTQAKSMFAFETSIAGKDTCMQCIRWRNNLWPARDAAIQVSTYIECTIKSSAEHVLLGLRQVTNNV